MPSSVRSTLGLGARAPQWEGGCRRRDVRPPQCRGNRQWCAGVGRPPILPPFPFENVSRWCWPECRLSPCFWNLDYLPLKMTVNVMASNRHLRWWSPPIWFVGEQTVGRVIVCPWSGEEVVALPSVSDVCWSCLSLVVPVSADTRAKPPATLVGVRNQRRLPPSVMRSSLGVTLPCRTLLLYMAWLRQSGTCPPLLQMAWSPGARVKWRLECMRWQRSCANSCLLVT